MTGSLPATEDNAAVRSSRRRLLWLALMFFGPLAISFLLYYGDVWRPEGGTNKGSLVEPPRPLPAIALTLPSGEQSSPEILHSRWSWVYIGNGKCDDRCRTALADIRQARLLLVEKAERVQRVFLATSDCCDMEYFGREHPGLIVARLGNTELAGLFQLDATPLESSGRIYLVDPLGNLMMSYAPDAPSMGLLEDIKKLLKLSHIG
jgi:cytochrome oxidase Cu insertion factor (SCO1/SenC/PrrC family)